ncbi:hypothetical protein [Halorussus marinus]|uniref:hypothetical protein n=1 Tax=Halorussus marinus TaxID=2505976 RepID=UPI00106DF5C9|nr:hypothetical protein [Halorussus marinus]
MRRVSRQTVLREWLRMERTDAETDRDPVEGLSERAVLDELLDHKPGAAAFVWRDAPVEWYELTLDRETFSRLRVIDGVDGLRWRALAPDDTVLGAARRVAREDPAALTARTGVDVERIRRFRADPPGGPLVLATRRGCVPVTVADGNHRAVALALDLLAGEPVTFPRAYLGRGANPVVGPLRQRVCGFVRGVLGRVFGGSGSDLPE